MRVDAVTAEYAAISRNNKVSKKESRESSSITQKSDKVTISTQSLALNSIREKIKAGYYNRVDVVEDITDKLAKIFDRD